MQSFPPYDLLLDWPDIGLSLHSNCVVFMQLLAGVWCNPCLFMVV